MATTRKRARTEDGQFTPDDPATPQNEAYEGAPVELPLNVASLAAFMAIEQPDRERLGLALNLAKESALAVTGQPVGDTAAHGIRHGVHMLAAQLLIKDQLEAAPHGTEIPGVIRYLWKAADAGR